MQRRRQHSIAFTVSVLLHGAVLLWGAFNIIPEFEAPEIEFEFTEVEMIDPNQIQGATPPEEPKVVEPPPPAPPQPTPPAPPGEEGPKPEDEPKEQPEEPQRDLGKKTSKVDQLGPTNSTFYALLVPKKIRKLPFREKAMDIMAPLPDFEFIITKGGFDPLRDFDHLIIASPDIRDVTQTFLAVDSTLPRAELIAGLERAAAAVGETIEWVDDGKAMRGNPRPVDPEEPDLDPRWFVLLPNDVAVYVRQEFLPNILDPQESDEKTAGNFVANLTNVRRFASRQPTAGLQVVMKDLHAALKRARGLPIVPPDRIELSAEAADEPELLITAEFLTVVDAKAAEKWWTTDLAAIIDDSFTLKTTVKWAYELLEIERDGKVVRLWGRFSTEQTEMVLGVISDVSAKALRKSPEEVEAARQRRLENWRQRQGGKVPPSKVFGGSSVGPSTSPSSSDDETPPKPAPEPDPAPPASPSGATADPPLTPTDPG